MLRLLLITALFSPVVGAVNATNVSWGIVIDCGSSGTRVRLYSWRGPADDVSEFVPEDPGDQAALETTPGISSFAGSPDGVADYLRPLLAQAARWVPAASQPSTRVRALATAGMRLLSEQEQAPIWEAAAAVIREAPFSDDVAARTISGEYEGLFNWLSIRYLGDLGLLRGDVGGDGSAPFGGLDLGGASTQITFVPTSGVILGDAYRVTLNGTTQRVYSHSYMRSGQDQAQQRLAQRAADADGSDAPFKALPSPCFNRGLSLNFTVRCGNDTRTTDGAEGAGAGSCVRELVGRGDYAQCSVLVTELLALDNECLLTPCAAHGVYQPPPAGVAFYAVSAFFYTASGIGLLGWDEQKALSSDQIAAAGAAFCASNWSAVASRYGGSYCFSSAYIVAMLVQAYGFPPDDATSVTFARKIHGFTAGWTLGAQLFFIDEQKCEIAQRDAPHGASGASGAHGGDGDGGRCAHALSDGEHDHILAGGTFSAVTLALLLGALMGWGGSCVFRGGGVASKAKAARAAAAASGPASATAATTTASAPASAPASAAAPASATTASATVIRDGGTIMVLNTPRGSDSRTSTAAPVGTRPGEPYSAEALSRRRRAPTPRVAKMMVQMKSRQATNRVSEVKGPAIATTPMGEAAV